MKHKALAILAIVMLVVGLIPVSMALATDPGAQVSHMTCEEMLVVFDKAPDGLEGTKATATISRPDGSEVTVTSGPGYYPGGSQTAKWSFPATDWWNGNGTYTVTAVTLPAGAGATVHNLPFVASVNDCGIVPPPPPPPPPPPDEMCEWDETIPADSDLCQVCPWDDSIILTNPLCVPPQVCPWDESLPATDPLCVVCEWDETIIASNPECVEPPNPPEPPQPPTPPEPPYVEGPGYCYANVNPTGLVVNGVPAKWEYLDGFPGAYGRAVFHSGSVNIGQSFWLNGQEWTSAWVNGEPICYPVNVPAAAPQGESPVTGGVPLAWMIEAWH